MKEDRRNAKSKSMDLSSRVKASTRLVYTSNDQCPAEYMPKSIRHMCLHKGPFHHAHMQKVVANKDLILKDIWH